MCLQNKNWLSFLIRCSQLPIEPLKFLVTIINSNRIPCFQHIGVVFNCCMYPNKLLPYSTLQYKLYHITKLLSIENFGRHPASPTGAFFRGTQNNSAFYPHTCAHQQASGRGAGSGSRFHSCSRRQSIRYDKIPPDA